jgi:hypothetical protein
MKRTSLFGVAFSIWMAMHSVTFARDRSAFQLAKEGDQYVGVQSKDRIVQIRSDKSVGSLTPFVWYVVYYDPNAALKAVEVKFNGDKMVDVQRPLRLLEPVTGGDLPLDRDKLKIDSDEALRIASQEPALQNLQLTAAKFKLERVGEGVLGRGPGEPVWKIELWGATRSNPAKEAHLGEVWVSAADGKVVKDDLHFHGL